MYSIVGPRLTIRINPLISRARALFSSSRVRALQHKDHTQTCQCNTLWFRMNIETHWYTSDSLDRVVHCLTDVQQRVENDGVSRCFLLVSKQNILASTKWETLSLELELTRTIQYLNYWVKNILDEDLHDWFTHLHPHTIFLEHVQKGQKLLLQS